MTKREAIYNKYNGRCAYSGTPLEDDWQIDHFIPKRSYMKPYFNIGMNDIKNLMPTQKLINHYKRGLTIDKFRNDWLGGLHKRLGKLPKNPRTNKGQRRKDYMLKIAKYFGITENNPFRGIFYYEIYEQN